MRHQIYPMIMESTSLVYLRIFVGPHILCVCVSVCMYVYPCVCEGSGGGQMSMLGGVTLSTSFFDTGSSTKPEAWSQARLAGQQGPEVLSDPTALGLGLWACTSQPVSPVDSDSLHLGPHACTTGTRLSGHLSRPTPHVQLPLRLSRTKIQALLPSTPASSTEMDTVCSH